MNNFTLSLKLSSTTGKPFLFKVSPSTLYFLYSSGVSNFSVSPTSLTYNYSSGASVYDFSVSPTSLTYNYESFTSQVVDSVSSNGVRTLDISAYATERSMTVREYADFEFNKTVTGTFTTNDLPIRDAGGYVDDNWQSQFDYTGINWNHIRRGTLITNQYIIQTAHTKTNVGGSVNFFASDGTLVTRTVADSKVGTNYGLPNSDFAILKLDSPVPDSIRTYPIIALDSFGVEADAIGSPVIALNQDGEGMVCSLKDLNFLDSGYVVVDEKPDVPEFMWKGAISGDSGSPYFIKVNGELGLLLILDAFWPSNPEYSTTGTKIIGGGEYLFNTATLNAIEQMITDMS